MKKEMFLLIILILLLPLISAKLSCSDNSQVIWDKREINEGSVKTINGIRMGLSKAEEFNVIKTFSADLILDAVKLSLSNETLPEESEISGKMYVVSLVNVTDTLAKINVNGQSKEIEEGELETINSILVFVVSADNNAGKPIAELIAGTKLISLSSDTNPSEEISRANITYIMELVYSSNTQSQIKVSKCDTGKIQEIQEPVPELQETDNKTIVANESETNIASQQTNITNVTSQNQTLSAPQNKTLGEICQNNSQCGTNFCKEGTCAKLSLWKRILNWFRNLF